MSNELMSEQTRILKNFYEQFDPHSTDDTPHLQRTRDEFNHLRQSQRPYPKLSDPLDALPPEIVLQCFMALPRDRSDSLDTLLTISKRWRYFAESASGLWSRVFLEDMERGNHRARRCLRLSRTSPLVVVIVLQPKLELASVFKEHTHRIQEITLRHRAYDMEFLSRDDLFLHAFRSLSKLGPLSSLSSLTYTTTFQSPLTIDGDRLPIMPIIRDLTGFSIRSNHTGLHYGSLLQISLELALPDVHTLVRECPGLEHLRLTGSPINAAFDRALHDFPLLKHLDFDRVIGLVELTPLLYTRCTDLVILQLHLQWSQLFEADYLGQLPHLITLKLNCIVYASVPVPRQLTLPPLRRVEEFHFIQVPIPSEEGMGAASTSQWSTSLFDALATSMHNVQSLKLSLVDKVSGDRLLKYLSRLTKLDDLELIHEKLLLGKMDNRTVLPSVKSLRLPNETLLLHVKLPRVSHLWIDSMAAEISALSLATNLQALNAAPNTSLHYQKEGLNDSFKLELPSVRELTWNGSAAIGILRKSSNFTTAFASIRRLVFAEPYARKDANDFCEVILRQPSKCPHLESISFHCYPSWDLLFYMLLRRNIMPDAITSPIRSIELPGYPCSTLLSPLFGLLSSTLTFIPPLSDIALNIRSGVFDPARRGCDCCLDCGLSCPLEVNHIEGDEEEVTPEMEEAVLVDQDGQTVHEWVDISSNLESSTPLPKQLKAWFDGWPQRRKAWNARSEESGKKFRRAFSCCKHDFDNLVTFTGGGR